MPKVEYQPGLVVDWTPEEMEKIKVYRKEAKRRREEGVNNSTPWTDHIRVVREKEILHELETTRIVNQFRAVWEDIRKYEANNQKVWENAKEKIS